MRTKILPRICPICIGSGKVTKTYDEYGIADPKEVQCYYCLGSGKILPYKDKD